MKQKQRIKQLYANFFFEKNIFPVIAKIKYEFSANIWQNSAPGGWYFVSLPLELSNEIRGNLQWQEEGWGRLKAIAKIGNSEWSTAIWFDTKHNTYLLPIKADIRRHEKIELNYMLEISIWI